MTTDLALHEPTKSRTETLPAAKNRTELVAELKTLLKSFRTSIRTTGRLALQIGERLAVLRDAHRGYGEWKAIREELKIGERSARVYMQLARAYRDNRQGTAGSEITTIDALLAGVKKGKRFLQVDDRKRVQAEALANPAATDNAYPVMHGDCRTLDWGNVKPEAIVTDPPWADMDLYRWLGQFAAERLTDGGLLLVQCGQMDMACVLAILTEKLVYQHCLAIVYPQIMPTQHPSFSQAWRPALVLTKGKWNRKSLKKIPDTYTVTGSEDRKPLHEWQQPLQPFVRWIDGLTRAGSLIVDPFIGSGTNALATKLAGAGRTFLGCDISEANVAVSRKRIAEGK